VIHTIISSLLEEKEAVILPEFGAFVFHAIPANVNPKTGRIVPAGRILRFQPQLAHQDGVLIGAISDKSGVAYGEANEMYQTWVQQLKADLQVKSSKSIGGVGRFYSEGSQLRFTPERELWESENAYGLYPFFMKPIIQAQQTPPVASVQSAPSKINRNAYWKVAAAIAIPITVAVFGMKIPFDGMSASLLSFGSTEPTYQEVERKISTPAVQSFAWQDILSESGDVRYFTYSMEDVNVAIENENAEPDKGYYLIQGCFRELENAEKQVARLVSKGFSNALILDYYKGLYRVALDHELSKTTARNKMRTMRSRFKGLWLAKVN
jgi:hypothetical protein